MCSIGYFDAPGSHQSSLSGKEVSAPLPEVTLVFLSVESLKSMKVS